MIGFRYSTHQKDLNTIESLGHSIDKVLWVKTSPFQTQFSSFVFLSLSSKSFSSWLPLSLSLIRHKSQVIPSKVDTWFQKSYFICVMLITSKLIITNPRDSWKRKNK